MPNRNIFWLTGSTKSDGQQQAATEKTPLYHGLTDSESGESWAAGTASSGVHSSAGVVDTTKIYTTKIDTTKETQPRNTGLRRGQLIKVFLGLILFFVILLALFLPRRPKPKTPGPYRLKEYQVGRHFFQHYNFFNGKDPTFGYNTYVDQPEAQQAHLYNVSVPYGHTKEHVFMTTAPTAQGPRLSLRLEGKTLFSSGLFIIDLQHMPEGCGVWPAFWLTNEKHWPHWGEVDIIEGIDNQPMVKTALHTSRGCTVQDAPANKWTGVWDVTREPGQPIFNTTDCWNFAPHQWMNQGCVAVNRQDGTLGPGLNKQGGGVFAMEWAPENGYIRSWAFVPHSNVPQNLKDALKTAANNNNNNTVLPDPNQWPLPYAYFPIGKGTTCPSHHFHDMRIVFDTAFCGSVAGPLFPFSCQSEAMEYGWCENYVRSNPQAMDKAFWEFRGVYVYQRD
uniref:GH16 domain-containing protein n=1 Tax=Cyclophora tenuis TaxID=216820 RepID=A0A7S1D1E6_CYCTE|mmetsp:Transcript_15886/g.26903  ORF Transcript_15886/g.26903 Transcript_15886/m.26903 type:complete len:448 (+) Transcript_15886:42-1385(+)